MLLDTSADLRQVGVGGALALLILDRVFAFLGVAWHHRRINGSNSNRTGDQPTEYWQHRFDRLTRQLEEIHEVLEHRAEIFARNADRLSEISRTLERLERDLENLTRESREGREKMTQAANQLLVEMHKIRGGGSSGAQFNPRR